MAPLQSTELPLQYLLHTETDLNVPLTAVKALSKSCSAHIASLAKVHSDSATPSSAGPAEYPAHQRRAGDPPPAKSTPPTLTVYWRVLGSPLPHNYTYDK